MLECSDVASQQSSRDKGVLTDRDSELDLVFRQTSVSYKNAVKLVVSAAREYFDASSTMDDPDMELARYVTTWHRLCRQQFVFLQ